MLTKQVGNRNLGPCLSCLDRVRPILQSATARPGAVAAGRVEGGRVHEAHGSDRAQDWRAAHVAQGRLVGRSSSFPKDQSLFSVLILIK